MMLPKEENYGKLLWEFLQQLLIDPAQRFCSYIKWQDQNTGVFKIQDPDGLSRLWGIQKNIASMNYEKMSRALRYYYKADILRKVPGERRCYQFLKMANAMRIGSLQQSLYLDALFKKNMDVIEAEKKDSNYFKVKPGTSLLRPPWN